MSSQRPEHIDNQMNHFIKVCAFLKLDKDQTANAMAFLLGTVLARLTDGGGDFTENEWMDVVSEAAATVTSGAQNG